MSSKVEICNLALSFIGHPNSVQSIDPPDQSREADVCAQFYPAARDQLLTSHAWSFATRRRALASVELPSYIYTWAYAYGLPNLCLREVAVLPPASATPGTELVWVPHTTADLGAIQDTQDPPSMPFEVETDDAGVKILYTNVQSAVLKYIWLNDNPGTYQPFAVQALARLLSSFLAGNLQQDDKKAAGALKVYEELSLPRAIGFDLISRQSSAYRKDWQPAHIRARS